MQTRNSMKSVLAQGATVVKAIEEALRKADMPQEFFVKILEEAQSGFLGFGAKKAKIALFFRKETYGQRGDGILSQSSYEDLFNNQSLQKQIDNQQREVTSPKDTKPAPSVSKPQAVAKSQAPQQPVAKRINQFQQRELRPVNPSNKENTNKENQGQARSQQVRPLEKTDKPQRPERRAQDIPQRTLPRRNESGRDESRQDQRLLQQQDKSNQIGLDKSKSDQSGSEQPQRSNYRNRRRSRYYSPRPRQGDGASGGSSSSAPKNNNNDSNNS